MIGRAICDRYVCKIDLFSILTRLYMYLWIDATASNNAAIPQWWNHRVRTQTKELTSALLWKEMPRVINCAYISIQNVVPGRPHRGSHQVWFPVLGPHMCAPTSFRTCDLICVFSYVLAYVRSPVWFHMCAFRCARMCVNSHVRSHLCALTT